MRSRILAALALAALPACHRDTPDDLSGVGTVEMVEVDVAPTSPARVERVIPREGATVKQGDVVAQVTQATMSADLDARRARLAGAEAVLRDLTMGRSSPDRARAAAELQGAEAEVARTSADLRRLTPLAESGTVSRQQLDAARNAAAQAVSRRDAARANLRLVSQGARPEAIAQAQTEVRAASAALRALESSAAELVLRAPISGVVSSRNAEPGEVLAAGQPAVIIADVSRPFVRVYLNEHAFSRVRVGQKADARLDAYPDTPIPGRVSAVATRAEFTPRVALTENERADLLFAVRVELADSTGRLKAGLPVTVHLLGTPP